MFRQALYVPVLRWKRAERVALRWLDSDVKALMTPLLEIPPTDFQHGTSNEALFAAAARRVAMNWGRAPAFVDFRLLGLGLGRSVSSPSIALFFSQARLYKLQLTPVTYLGLPPEFQRVIGSVVNHDGRGVCIRLASQNLASRTLPSDLHHLAAALGLRYEEMDLVVDLRIAETSNPSFVSLFDCLPAVERWRSFTVIAGAFPKDLTEFSVGQHLYPRVEWAQWINQVRSAPPEQMRIPTFGDYTIQHAVYYEPPEGANVSASIRYTTDEHWLVMRGGGLRTPGSTGHKQYPANAQLLCERKEFCGSHFSRGDEYIWQVASGEIKTSGNPETWLRAGINHHLTFVVRQVSAVVGL